MKSALPTSPSWSGYLKEAFEYLIDLYGVKLLYNPDYSTMNNISSVYHAASLFEDRNVYLLSSDNWMQEKSVSHLRAGQTGTQRLCERETREWVLHYNKKEVITGGRGSAVAMRMSCTARFICPARLAPHCFRR